MSNLRIAFFGAPEFAAHVLERIIQEKDIPVTVSMVVTQPDRPTGRERNITPTPVRLVAQKYDIPVFEDIKLPDLSLQLEEVDLALLYAYGELISPEMLNIPRWGFWNIHPSLLPRFRGPSPIAYALLLGERQTGVSLMQLERGLDSGPIIDQETYTILPTDTQYSLKYSLSDIGYKLFKKNVQLLIDGAIQKKEQDINKATYTRLLTKSDGFIPWDIVQQIMEGKILTKEYVSPIITEYSQKYGLPQSFSFSLSAFNLFRGLSPWPGLWTKISVKGVEKRLKITGMEVREDKPIITRVQLEGKKEVEVKTFLTAYQESLHPSQR